MSTDPTDRPGYVLARAMAAACGIDPNNVVEMSFDIDQHGTLTVTAVLVPDPIRMNAAGDDIDFDRIEMVPAEALRRVARERDHAKRMWVRADDDRIRSDREYRGLLSDVRTERFAAGHAAGYEEGHRHGYLEAGEEAEMREHG